MGSCPPVIALEVRGFCLDSSYGIRERVPVTLHAQVGKGAISVVHGILVVQLDRLRVQVYALLVVLFCGGQELELNGIDIIGQ